MRGDAVEMNPLRGCGTVGRPCHRSSVVARSPDRATDLTEDLPKRRRPSVDQSGTVGRPCHNADRFPSLALGLDRIRRATPAT